MATAKIQGNPLGSGSVTLAAPNTNSDFTLTLPAENGALLTSSGTQAAAFSTLAVAGSNVSTVNGNWRNRIINGAMQVAQRATTVNGISASTAVPTASTGYRNVDRFFIYSTIGAFSTTIASSSGANTLRINGAGLSIGVGVGQRIEQKNSFDLAGSTATLSVDLATASEQTVTWTVSYANTADTFGTIGTPTKTQIATGTFATTFTTTRYTATMNIPLAATTGIEVLLTVSSLNGGSDFLFVGNMQFEAGSVATPFERRPFGTELALCQRYFQTYSNQFALVSNTAAANANNKILNVPMRVGPTITQTTSTGTGGSWGCSTTVVAQSGTHSVDAATSVLTLGAEL